MKYICPEKDCTDWGNGECPHGVPHEEDEMCSWNNNICPNCIEVEE